MNKFIKEIISKEIVKEVEEVKNILLVKVPSSNSTWSYNINYKYLENKGLIPAPHIGRDQFTNLERVELVRVVDLLKDTGAKKVYITTLKEFWSTEEKDKIYEMDIEIDLFTKFGLSVDQFRNEGDVLILSERLDFFFILEWDLDIVIGSRDFVEKYFNGLLLEEIKECESFFYKPISERKALIVDSLAYLKKCLSI